MTTASHDCRGSSPHERSDMSGRTCSRWLRACMRAKPVVLMRRFGQNATGASAVEFSLIAVPFISLIAATVQTGLVVWTSQTLDDSLQKAVRAIYIGSFQAANQGQTSSTVLNNLKAKMCGTSSGRIATVFDCNNLKLDVVLSSTFNAAVVPVALNPTTRTWATSFGTRYTCASPGSIVVVTAAVKYPVFFSFLNVGVPTFSDGARLLQSTAVFRTEPNDTSSC